MTSETAVTTPSGLNQLYSSLRGEWECSRSELEIATAHEANDVL